MKARLARLLACALPHLAIIAVMLLALSPQANAFWQCQGRACGATAWTCCCNSRSNDCGRECVSSTSLSPERAPSGNAVESIGSRAGGCHCTVVTQVSPESVQSHAAFFAPPVFWVTVVIPTLRVEVAPPVVLTGIPESRGPPKAVYLASLSVRGPPRA